MKVAASNTPTVNPPSKKPRRFGCLGILLAIALAVGVVYLAVLGLKAIFKPGVANTGDVLYATVFDNPADTEWYQYQGALSTQITDGTMVISADTAKSGTYSDLDYIFRDFDARVVARQVAGDDPYNEYGILFRYQDRDNFYMFKVRADGSYHITRNIKGKQEDLSAPHPAPGIAVGLTHVNDLRVVGKGDHFQFYINGQLLTLCPKGTDKFSTWDGDQCLSNNKQTSQELIDSTFSEGKLALGVYENAASIQVAFSNFLLMRPAG